MFKFAGNNETKTIVLDDKELSEIVAMFDEGDRYAVEQEVQKRVRERRPGENIFIHCFSTNPLMFVGAIGNIDENWWEGMF